MVKQQHKTKNYGHLKNMQAIKKETIRVFLNVTEIIIFLSGFAWINKRTVFKFVFFLTNSKN